MKIDYAYTNTLSFDYDLRRHQIVRVHKRFKLCCRWDQDRAGPVRVTATSGDPDRSKKLSVPVPNFDQLSVAVRSRSCHVPGPARSQLPGSYRNRFRSGIINANGSAAPASKLLPGNGRFDPNRIESNRIESNRIESNRIESNRIESNRIESNRIESNRIESNRIEKIGPRAEIELNRIERIDHRPKSNRIESVIDRNWIESNRIDLTIINFTL